MKALFDLDGCLSDDTWRQQHLPPHHSLDPADYESYHAGQYEDLPINLSLFEYAASLDVVNEIVFVTARPEAYRDLTKRWIDDNLPVTNCEYRLLMRPDGNTMVSPTLKIWLLHSYDIKPADVALAFDDRADVLQAYTDYGIATTCILDSEGGKIPGLNLDQGFLIASNAPKITAAEILMEAGKTYGERNKVYGDNYRNVMPVVEALFPDGVPPELILTNSWHLFELMIVKFTRFANSEFTHRDSIHDAAVYAAMIEANIATGEL